MDHGHWQDAILDGDSGSGRLLFLSLLRSVRVRASCHTHHTHPMSDARLMCCLAMWRSNADDVGEDDDSCLLHHGKVDRHPRGFYGYE